MKGQNTVVIVWSSLYFCEQNGKLEHTKMISATWDIKIGGKNLAPQNYNFCLIPDLLKEFS